MGELRHHDNVIWYIAIVEVFYSGISDMQKLKNGTSAKKNDLAKMNT